MTDLAQIKFYVTSAFRDALDDHLKSINYDGNRSDFIVEAIRAKAGIELPAASAPHGVRNDALPRGWKSRLYQDRYQINAVWNGKSWEFCDLHQQSSDPNEDASLIRDTLRADWLYTQGDGIKFEVYVYAPARVWESGKSQVAHDLHLALQEWMSI